MISDRRPALYNTYYRRIILVVGKLHKLIMNIVRRKY